MLKKLQEVKRLQDELEEEYGIISISKVFERVQVYGMENFIEIVGKNEIILTERDDEEIPYEVSFDEFGFTFVCLLYPEDYAEYKKSRAENTTSDEL